MDFLTFRNIIQANLPFGKGGMFEKGVTYFDTPHYFRAKYNTNALPYIVWQETGFTHWITKERVEVHKGFITVDTAGHLNRAIQSEILGLPFPQHKAYEKVVAQRNNSIILTKGGMTV